LKAIILAAGACRRLRPYTDNIPKCLVDVGPKAILGHQLDAIIAGGITEVVIVVGYLKEQIYDYISRNYPALKVKFIVNEQYGITNTLYSLWLTKEEMAGSDFLYFNADVIFHPEVIHILTSKNETCMAVDFKKCGEEEVKVILNGQAIIEIGKKLDVHKAAGEFIGIARFNEEINPVFITKLEEGVQKGHGNAFFELAVDEMLSEVNISAIDISHLPSIEIDFPEDLETARKVIYPRIAESGKTYLDEVAAAREEA